MAYDDMKRQIEFCDTARDEVEAEFNKLAPRDAWWPHVDKMGAMQGLHWGWSYYNGMLFYTAQVVGDDERIVGRDEEFKRALIRAVNNTTHKFASN